MNLLAAAAIVAASAGVAIGVLLLVRRRAPHTSETNPWGLRLYRTGIGALKPVAMERTLDVLDGYRRVLGDSAPLPCDEQGRGRT